MAIDFAAPYFNEESVVITKRPQEESRVLLFLRPFSYVQLAGDVTCIIFTWSCDNYYKNVSINTEKQI